MPAPSWARASPAGTRPQAAAGSRRCPSRRGRRPSFRRQLHLVQADFARKPRSRGQSPGAGRGRGGENHHRLQRQRAREGPDFVHRVGDALWRDRPVRRRRALEARGGRTGKGLFASRLQLQNQQRRGLQGSRRNAARIWPSWSAAARSICPRAMPRCLGPTWSTARH